ncbi:MAG: UDP-N-acetylglucosamine 2-epimerase (non-hydrolyzing), partial [Verrucomicrobia bacterium]|nr:UDP-N-acetylglucosamine 2-epimerase (non-hydrolyzing) [Verrucomicrobiota bacterium]
HRALLASGKIDSRIVHTGQHYDEKMSDIFFKQLGLPEPHVYMGIGSGSHSEQTGKVMIGFEKVLEEESPDLVIVVGDVNSTLACSITAVKCGILVAHVEAGLRSFDRGMPEEINRMVTDRISDYLFVTEQSGIDNLEKEGVPSEQIFMVGNVMIDSLIQFREKASESTILESLGIAGRPFALMTLHRPSNVDQKDTLIELLRIVENTANQIHLVFPMHPRTRKQLETFGLLAQLTSIDNVTLTEPLGYLEFLRLMDSAKAVITDSGGIQEETTYLQVPCLTLRDNTERPITVTSGTNELLPVDHRIVSQRLSGILEDKEVESSIPPLWDGKASERITKCILEILNNRTRQTR